MNHHEFIQRWEAAVAANDLAAMAAMFADDAIFRSPAVFKPYQGRAVIQGILGLVMQVFGPLTYSNVWSNDRGGVVMQFTTTVPGPDKRLEIEGVDIFQLDEAGQISELRAAARLAGGGGGDGAADGDGEWLMVNGKRSMVNEAAALAGDDAAYWDELFGGLAVVEAAAAEHWIERVLPDAAARVGLGARVLELGCGLGYDTRWLVQAGCHVTALDGSAAALDRLTAALPGPEYVHHRLPAPLPFADASFDAVVAGLSLHYFSWNDTLAIINEVHRVLRPAGLLSIAVNAAGDVNYGYGQGSEVEPGLFDVNGRLKRFFTEADCRRLLATGWDLLALLPLEEQRYGRPKRMWVAAARRSR